MRLRARQTERAAKKPITRPAGTNFGPSHGSVPSSAKQPKAARQSGRASSRIASSAAPASATPAAGSGYTALP